MKMILVRLRVSDWVGQYIPADKVEEFLKDNPNWEVSPDQ